MSGSSGSVERTGARRPLMAWAMDEASGRPVYVGSLPRECTGLKCRCVCTACGTTLEAVNAGQPPAYFQAARQRRAFFRHHTGNQATSCLTTMARLVALRLLVESEQIELPTRRVQVSIAGVSGHLYTGVAEFAAQSRRIIAREWIDRHNAMVRLEDGRTVLVTLIGRITAGTDRVDGVVSVEVSDPAVATWSPQQILGKARLLADCLCWTAHWDDAALGAKAHEAATASATQACDCLPDDQSFPDGLSQLQRSESVLHFVLKQILAQAATIMLPAADAEMIGAVPLRRFGQSIGAMPVRVTLVGARLECRMGSVVPDVICQVDNGFNILGSNELLIEVAVTHRVDETKLAHLRTLDIACIELDASFLGAAGPTALSRLRNLVVDGTSGKRWLHHPALSRKLAAAQEKKDEEAREVRALQERRGRLAKQFMKAEQDVALRQYGELLAQSWKNPHHMPNPAWNADIAADLLRERGLGVAVDPWLTGRDGVLRILYRLKGPGYSISAGIEQALEALQFPSDQRKITYYLIALSVLKPDLDEEVQQEIDSARRAVLKSLNAGELTYARPGRHDFVVAALYPELAERMKNPTGTEAEAKRVRSQLESVQRKREAEERGRREQREREQAIEKALGESTASWTVKGSQPLSVDFSHRRVRGYAAQFRMPIEDFVQRAWDARESDVAVSDFLRGCTPDEAQDVRQMRYVLKQAWLIE